VSRLGANMQLSIVATLYRSAAHLPEFIERVRAVAAPLFPSFELILVNDESPDDSLSIAIEFARRHGGIAVIDLARHYGHYEAILAGLRAATGDYVFLIDSDLEEPPELLIPLWSALRTSEADFSVACQETRRRGTFMDLGGAAFYSMLRCFGKLDVPRNNLVARVMTRRYVDALIALREPPVSFDAHCARAGMRYVTVPAQKGAHSPTTYSLVRRAALFIDSMLTYTGIAERFILFLVAGVILAAVLTFSLRMFRVVQYVGGLVVIFAAALAARRFVLWRERSRYRPAEVREVHSV
jgi:putative glycosyltransferase